MEDEELADWPGVTKQSAEEGPLSMIIWEMPSSAPDRLGIRTPQAPTNQVAQLDEEENTVTRTTNSYSRFTTMNEMFCHGS